MRGTRPTGTLEVLNVASVTLEQDRSICIIYSCPGPCLRLRICAGEGDHDAGRPD